ncbi:MAG: regulatory protein RecX [Peptococcia bacterium]
MPVDEYLELAVKKLWRYSYSEAEIRQHLRKAGASVDEADEVVKRLLELSYLDDLLLAQDIIRSIRRGKPSGRLIWKEKLKQRGIPQEIISKLLEECDREEELELARQASDIYLKSKIKKSFAQQYSGLIAYLNRRGFPGEIVEQVIRELYDNC